MSLSKALLTTEKIIQIFQPELRTEELEAVRKVFESNWIGKGKITDQFETGFADFLGTRRETIRSITCCTEGLFQSMELLRVGPGDEVILPSISFVGAANAVASCGARPVFCDVDKRELNPTAELIEQKITNKTKAVIILHYGGVPCLIDEIYGLTRQKKIALIEDSACSVASRYKGKACGTFGDIGVWSFDAMKILVTGDGGMIYCRDPETAKRAEEQTYLGLTTRSGTSNTVDKKWWEFEISCFGRRAIMNDVSSAIGLVQLKKLPHFINRRKEIHETYESSFSKLDWLKPPPTLPSCLDSSYYFYWVQTQPELRDQLAQHLRDNNIYTTFRYYPLHRVKYYGSTGRLPNSEEAAKSTLCIPIHQSLTDSDLDRIIECIRSFGKQI